MAELNMKYYQGIDSYSDGAIEDEMLALFEQGMDVEEVLARDNRWPLLYHLAPARRALLEWYPFPAQTALLEVGAGCGALTGLFCEKTAQVTAVELSARRSRIIAARHQHVSNLEIMVGNIMQMPPRGSFDIVTLIGVLEYANSFVESPRPAETLLRHLAAFLKPGGHLLLAIENRFGLKYFAGAPDDHTARMFDSIEGYPDVGKAMTFSRNELATLLAGAGYGNCQWYYPHPDYKFPTEVYGEDYLPGITQKLATSCNFDHDRFLLFNERLVMSHLIANGQFEFFANSFLVDAVKV